MWLNKWKNVLSKTKTSKILQNYNMTLPTALPISITFKVFALGSQLYIRDSNSNLLLYVKQKLFKLKENIEIYSEEERTNLRYTIKADRVLDFNANYTVTNAEGNPLCIINREGIKSLWKATFNIATASGTHYTIREGNPFAKVMDGFFGEIPIIGMLSGYVFQPYYTIETADGTHLFTVHKKRAFLEGKFTLEPEEAGKGLGEAELTNCLMGTILMVLMERRRS